MNDRRPKLEKQLTDGSIGTIVVENHDRLTRFESHCIETLLAAQGRRVEMIFASETGDERVDDVVAVIISMATRLSGRRHSKHRAETIKHGGENLRKEEINAEEETGQ